jgi:hypothetical protein
LPYFLALKAEALHLANRTCESLEAIREAEALAERSEGRWSSKGVPADAILGRIKARRASRKKQ